MNSQIAESEVISVSSFEPDGKAIENATQAFLDAALTGDLQLLTSLYNSGTKVCKVSKLLTITRPVEIYNILFVNILYYIACNTTLNDR